jgi:TPP-dependent pyruvate/acetoin dehydrogenase alpha subunit
MGTAIDRHQSRTDIHEKAANYGIPAEPIDGMDVLAVEQATRLALDSVRSGAGPFLLEARTYRFRAHSMYDAELYRTKEEVQQWKRRDPIALFTARLREASHLTDDDVADIEARVTAEIDQAVATAERGPWEPLEDLTRDVYTPRTAARVTT